MLGGWGGNRGPGGMAAYRRVYGFGHLYCGLTAEDRSSGTLSCFDYGT